MRAGETVPVLLPNASHQEVTSCRELDAVDKTHLEGTRQVRGSHSLLLPPRQGNPHEKTLLPPSIPNVPIHTKGMSQRGSSFRNPSLHFQSFTLVL